jgi:hypothetical protein
MADPSVTYARRCNRGRIFQKGRLVMEGLCVTGKINSVFCGALLLGAPPQLSHIEKSYERKGGK